MEGLNNSEVDLYRKKYGSNEIKKEKSNTLLKLFLESLGDPIIKILLIALAIKILFLFKDFDWYETVGIVIAILIASLVSSITEYGSEKAFEKLQEESIQSKVRVKRNGRIDVIGTDDIVKNDVVLLDAGEKISADGYLIKGAITVNESSLTGESIEVKKTVSLNKNDSNKLFRGTIVYSGEGIMKVTEVGESTLYGSLAQELKTREPISPLKLRLRGLANTISKIGYIGAILVSISYLFSVLIINNDFNLTLIMEDLTNFKLMLSYLLYALTLSVTIIVVAVPEGLPMMITLVLSTNMKKMLKENVLVRKLVGIETSGSLNVLLTDKTGTLTKGTMEVINIVDGNLKPYQDVDSLKKNSKYYDLVNKSFLYNNMSVYDNKNDIFGGNSTDRALLKYIGRAEKKFSILDSIPFDSNNKYSLTIIDDDKKRVLIKGASEKILPYCTSYYDSFGRKLELHHKSKILNYINNETKKGVRVLITATNEDCQNKNYFKNLTLVAIVLIKDEIRPEAKEGISLVKGAHIQTIMITGDAKETAITIGREVGLLENNDDIVLTSDELKTFSDEEIKMVFKNIKIIARALPSDKSRLVTIGEELNLVVGMTGDGINDAPALKKANVGFAMGSGTEVAKEASDIVILDDNIMSISKAILYGRTTFKSIRKFLIFQLTVNMCALIMSIIGPFIGIETPITIVQMLWLNMIMDTFAGLAFSKEPPLLEYMKEPPKKKSEPIINKYMISEILFTGAFSALICVFFLKMPFIKDTIRYQNKYFLTAFFSLFIFIDIFNAFNARTHRLNLLANITKNKLFIIIISFIIIIQIYLIYFGGTIFRTYGLTIKELFLVVLMSALVVPIDFFRKLILRFKGIKKGT